MPKSLVVGLGTTAPSQPLVNIATTERSAMSVAARFYITEITTFAYDPSQARIKLQAACRGEENKAWASATPSGSIEMHVNNPDAVAWFRECLDERQDIALSFEKRDPQEV